MKCQFVVVAAAGDCERAAYQRVATKLSDDLGTVSVHYLERPESVRSCKIFPVDYHCCGGGGDADDYYDALLMA